MAIQKPTKNELFQSALGDLQQKTNETFSSGEMIYELLKATSTYAEASIELTTYENKLNFWLEKCTSDELDFVGGKISTPRIQAKQSSGNIFIQGAVNTQIPSGSLFSSPTNDYYSNGYREIVENVINIKTITRIGTVATVVLSSDENLPTGAVVSISGFSESNFNVTDISITAISSNSFSYNVEDTGGLNDTDGVCTFIGCTASLLSQEYSLSTEVRTRVSLSNSLNVQAIVSYEGITGGSNIETDANYLARIFDKINNNTPKNTRGKIINSIIEQFPQVTNGKVLVNYSPTLITIQSIEKVENEPNEYIRKVTTAEKHGLREHDMFKSITGSSQNNLIINESYDYNRFVGQVYDEYSFAIVVSDTTSEDNTSTMYLERYNEGYSTIALYKASSVIKTLTTAELNSISNYVDTVVPFVIDSRDYTVISAEEQLESIDIVITPNLISLQNAIRNNIVDYVKSNATIGGSIKKSQIDNVIVNTIDINGNIVQDFSNNMLNDWAVSTEYKIITILAGNINFG